MANKIRVKIDVTKILKEHLFVSKKTGAKYLDCTLIPSPNSQYGDTHFIVQDLPKELREAGEKGPILGNAKEWEPYPEEGNARPTRTSPAPIPDEDTDVPF